MKLFSLALVSGLIAVASAQSTSTSDLPDCSRSCIGGSINVPGCSSIDIACICKNNNYLQNLACCVRGSCDAADLQSTINFAISLCKSAGVMVNTNVGSDCPSSSGSAAPSSTSAGSSSAGSSMGSSSSSSASSSAAAASATSKKTSNPAGHNSFATGGALAGGAAALLALL